MNEDIEVGNTYYVSMYDNHCMVIELVDRRWILFWLNQDESKTSLPRSLGRLEKELKELKAEYVGNILGSFKRLDEKLQEQREYEYR